MEEAEVKSSPADANAEVLELHVTGDLDDFQSSEPNVPQDNSIVDMNDENMDKEKLRKIKQKMKRSLNRRKKKLLSRNLKNFSAVGLQQSVADVARGIAVMREDPFPASSSFVNDPCAPNNSHSAEASLQASNLMPNVSYQPSSAEEIIVCVMDPDNLSYRLSLQDLAYINDGLEKSMYKDLTITPKLKICNSFLSWTKQVWIICLTQYTANWVIQKVKEIKTPSGRRFSACLANEITCLTAVTMLVPKECGFVDSYASLMRFLIIHNPTLGLGTTRELSHAGRSKIGIRQDISINENSTSANNEPDANDSSILSQSCESKASDEPKEKSAACFATEQQPGLCVDVGNLEAPRRARCFNFYADDTWLQELKQLTHGPFLGLRRLPFVLGDRTVVRTGEAGGRISEKISLNSKNFRGCGGGRNRKKKVTVDPVAKGIIEVE